MRPVEEVWRSRAALSAVVPQTGHLSYHSTQIHDGYTSNKFTWPAG